MTFPTKTRQFYRTITVDVLSEEPIPDEMDLVNVLDQAVNGEKARVRSHVVERLGYLLDEAS